MSRAQLVGEDFDDLYFLLEGGFLDNDEDFHIQLDIIVSEISSDEDKTGRFKCKHCEKVCKSKRGISKTFTLKWRSLQYISFTRHFGSICCR